MRSLLIMFVLAQVSGFGRQSVQLPDTPTGKHVEAYIRAFNKGEGDMRTFFLQHGSNNALKQVPLDRRLNAYRQMHERLGSLELRKINESDKDHLNVLFHTGNGQLVSLEFEFERSAPYGLVSVRVEDVESRDVPSNPRKDIAELVDTVERYADDLAGKDQFSGVILIARNGKPVFQHAYGYADREQKVPNRIDTKFNIGSINKAFTNLAIHQLAAAEKLSLGDHIGKYLGDYPNKEAAEKVTVEELLKMTSGIGDFFNERFQETQKGKLKSIDAYLPLFADKPLEFEPGTKRRYSNGGFVVLGAIIERVSGQDYYSYVREHIFKPAGMNETDSYEKDVPVDNRALGYTREGSTLKTNYDTLPGKGSSAGGGYSTVEDLLRYTIALEEGRIGTPGEEQLGGFGIAGGAPGLNAALEWISKKGCVIVVMSNFDPPSAERMAQQIRAWLPVD